MYLVFSVGLMQGDDQHPQRTQHLQKPIDLCVCTEGSGRGEGEGISGSVVGCYWACTKRVKMVSTRMDDRG